MHRWFGSSSDSDKQASERDARAARRIIASQPELHLSEDEPDDFEDCNTSVANVSIFQGDGADDEDLDSASIPDYEPQTPPAIMPPVPFDMENKENDEDSWKKEVKIPFEPHDVSYWFNSVEAKMKKFGPESSQ